jgi:hypothetical protein
MAGLPFLTPSRCVLLITDDALCVYDVSSRATVLLDSVPWRRPEFENTVADIINSGAGGKSVMILNDAVEQHYRKEKVPRIAMFDRSSIVQRRLSVAFPNYPIRAAMELRDKSAKKSFSLKPAPRDGKGRVDGQLYLFAAIPSSDAYSKTLEAVSRSSAGIAGYCLLPVESSDLVKELSDRLSKQKRTRANAVWSVLIGQHHGGGLRQIVTKNGELALTRITPVSLPDENTDAQAWCTEVAQEFQATLSYLSRFGYNPEDGLSVMVIAKPELGDQLESLIDAPCTYHALTVMQAAETMGLRLSRQTEPHYADVLHAAWSGRKFVPDLGLTSRDLKRISGPRRAAAGAMLLMTLALGYFGFAASNEAQAVYQATKNIEVAKDQKKKIDDIYTAELKRKEDMGIDVKLIQGSLLIHDRIEAEKVDLLPLLKIIAEELRNLRIDGFAFSNPAGAGVTPTAGTTAPGAEAVPVRPTSLRLMFSFAGTIQPKDGNKEINDFKERLAAKLPDYEVIFDRKLQDLSYTGALTQETGITATARGADDRYEAEVLIKRIEKVAGK